MSSLQGHFVWYELMTPDAKAAESFYNHVIGWSARDAGMPMPYTIFSNDTGMVCGMMQLSGDGAGAQPGWLGYVWVDDVDVFAERVTKAGGKIHRGPADIPNVGRFAIVADPQGTTFALFKGLMEGKPPAPFTPGRFAWHELHAADRESAFAFYSRLLGWQKKDALDMGAMGIYQIYGTGDQSFGGMMTKMPAEPKAHWLYYIAVPKIEAAAARVKEKGGQIINGPQEVPGGNWIVQGFDPHGVMFALVGPKG